MNIEERNTKVAEAEETEEMEEMDPGRTALNRYMAELMKYEMLTKEESLELGKMLKNEETKEYARKRLVEGNLRLVVNLAHKWTGRGLSLADLISVGNVALMEAVNHFDVDCCESFASYANWWIRTYASRAISNNRMVRIPVASELKKRNVERFIESFKRDNGREPSKNEIQREFRMSDVEFKNLGRLKSTCVSLNAKLDDSDSDSAEVEDVMISDENTILDSIAKREDAEQLHIAIAKLSPVEQVIIKMRFGIGLEKVATLNEVADVVGKTSETVRRLQNVALAKLRRVLADIL